MRLRGALSFAAFAVIVFFSFGYFTSMGVSIRPASQRTNLSMEVPDINGLVVGSSVQLRGVSIGEVSNIAATVGGAIVSFYIDSHYKIPTSSNVRLENLSALGEAYVELVPRGEGGPLWHDGQRIATEAIMQPPSISELAASVVRVLNQLDPKALKDIVDETDAALPNPATVLPNLSRTATLVRNTAATMHGKGRDLLDNFQALFRNADFVGPTLAYNAPYLPRFGRVLDSFYGCIAEAYNRGAPQTIRNFAHFVARIEHLLDHSSGDIKVLMQAMLPYLNDLAGALSNLDTGRVFRDMLAALPEDGAVTLHVTVPDAATPETPTAAPPNVPAIPASQDAAASAPVTAPTRAPHSAAAGVPPTDVDPESVLPVAECRPILPTSATPAPHADATPRTGKHPIPAAAPGN